MYVCACVRVCVCVGVCACTSLDLTCLRVCYFCRFKPKLPGSC